MECKANCLAQVANWLRFPRAGRSPSSSRPATTAQKLPVSAESHHLSLMGKVPHVGIIGAGISGLRCADILTQNGAKVTILEARDRIGGRTFNNSKQIAQVEVGGHLVDLGPNWIHGTDGNPIAEISVRSNTTTCEWDGRETIFDTAGKPYDDATTTKLAEWMWTTIDEAFEYSNKYKEAIPASKSLFDFCRERVEETDFTQEEKEACLEFSRFWGAYVGDPIEKQSLRFFCLEECIEGTNLFVASTYKNILKYVSESALKRADLRLNEPVIKIESAGREPGAGHQIVVTSANGEVYHFDEVVVTCPLGWLKQNKSVFVPELPQRLSAAIDNISYGRLEKIYVTFPRAFWHVASEPQSKNGGSAGIGTGTEYPPPFTQFLEPSYVDYPKEGSWNQQCVSLAALPPNCAHPTLLFYLYGPCATYVVSKIKDLDQSSESYYNFLNDFLHPFYSCLPHYSPSSADCKPVALFASQWQNDPFAGNGSYSNFQVGLEAGDKDIETMRIGMGPDRGIWFAGEHTAPFVGLGTTTGAYWSGERAAGQICDLYSLGKLGMGVKRDDSLPSATAASVPGGPAGVHAGAGAES
ncbi:Monoamine oxidase [Rasamsonia emersonii CBS 393.64]|uniref:Monoamine oxidase n=1 Tax=Rasamsonia emersonii (strain ATCC 16479 / CBS 393.64 / IMI 116815) TaxID=1408163 RepID=A0A0F4YR06_RASE3|nr:Monoamine oxidase [Rasamsonia emersonii CBS 393.64]KKA20664.1 Monoamine oxidase [Rasamsonia emersonii CBS 393.64]